MNPEVENKRLKIQGGRLSEMFKKPGVNRQDHKSR